MKKEDELFFDMVRMAQLALEELTEDEIQEWFGSDYYNELKNYLKDQGGKIK